MENEIYYGRGNAEMFDEYVDFINYVFGFNGNGSDFKKLLPKLYAPEYDPCGNSYVAVEDGKLKSAIGAFDHDMTVCGVYLKTRGIGNVAVHPYERSRGFMKKLLNMAIDDMIADGVVLSVLGGRRQRYNYFSYDKCGTVISMSLNDDNMRHVFGRERKHDITFRIVKAEDTDLLAEIRALSEAQDFVPDRTEGKRYFQILSSWNQKVAAGFCDGSFIGYAVFQDTTVQEVLLKDPTRICEFAAALYDFRGAGKLYFKFPPFAREYITRMIRFCEHYDAEPPKMFSVLSYRPVVEAFLKLKATYCSLPDGALTLRVNGRGGTETIRIEVKGGVPSVVYTDDEPEYTLGHLDAMNLLFACVCPVRDDLPDFARIWLPLPIWTYSSDAV